MKIGFIGAGIVAQSIAKHTLSVGHEVVLSNSREPESLASVIAELGSGAAAGTAKEAAEQDLVVLATKWWHVQAALFSVSDWKGRILVDTTNRVASYQPLMLGDISGRTSSEIVADLAPGARVVKAFNTVPMSWISDFSPAKRKTAFFVSGDDADAKKRVTDLIEQIGFYSLDLGSLAVGGRLQQTGGPLVGVNLTFNERFVLPTID
ncbi:NAD(P)-binding domain-containing protein [Paraburkholderia sprentiae WSM5005]|uniref:NAD(P)-binding domain-containing protein n=1 Tax=Paraburkholderia sprentiae WSM5005 TaxID=754502 RepID=A0A1I9YPK3_9BURK|nr:NAD(P)-binding domain-containing protein [Paraburkholderia sprentiae]APA88236.1 NAD(P)-binding domain-containing protein [Paraburkholderia sprentiae WSM5005]